MPATAVTTYLVNAADCIRSVSATWLGFAHANGASELTRERVVGHKLWDFVRGEQIRELYGLVMEAVRRRDTPVILPFRCDSPDCRRYMRLVISHIIDGTLQFDSVLSRVEERPHLRLGEPEAVRSDSQVPICSQCKRLYVEADGWLEPEDVIVRLGLLETDLPPRLQESLCTDCGAVFENELTRLAK